MHWSFKTGYHEIAAKKFLATGAPFPECKSWKRWHASGVSAGAPPCFGHKGRKFRETDALVDLSHRPFMALLLLFLGDSLSGHGYLGSSD